MKDKIHPKFNVKAQVFCACGNTFATGSTTDEIRTEVCSNCHPFYTGKQKMLDTTGTVDRFKKRTAKAITIKAAAAPKKERKVRAKK